MICFVQLSLDSSSFFVTNESNFGVKSNKFFCYFLFSKEIILLQWNIFVQCNSSLWNSGAQYISNKMLRQFQNFSVCLSNTLEKKLLKTQQKHFHITLAMAVAYVGILPRAVICFFNSSDYSFYLNHIVYS